jgi:hypothetical protein
LISEHGAAGKRCPTAPTVTSEFNGAGNPAAYYPDEVFGTHNGQIISGVGPFLERRAIERHAYACREQFVSRGDKAVRAQSMRGRMAMLGLYVRQGAPWFADLRAELLSFPAGKHDDQVDALGLVGQLLDKISAGPRPKPPEVTQRDGYRAAFEQMPDDSWKTM